MAKHRDDVAPAVAAVRLDGGRLVAALRVVGDEPVEEFLDRGRLPGCRPLGAGIDAPPNFGQPVLGDPSGLLDGDLTVAADSGLSPLPVVGDIGDHEDLAACRGDLDKEAGYRRIPEFVIALLRGCGVYSGLGEFDFGHS